MKFRKYVFTAGLLFILGGTEVSAHVTVKPAQVNVGQFQSFNVGVPTEKNIPTISVRLMIPDGLQHVSPTVKPGWKISVKKEGEGEEAVVKEIMWSGGQIPEGFRDDFTFSAKAPAETTTLLWKAYQTYEDGTVVSWDQAPEPKGTHSEEDEDENAGPYSETEVKNDLAESQNSLFDTGKSAFILSILALLASLLALRKPRSNLM